MTAADTRPAPPVPGDLDLRDWPDMMVDVSRMRDSRTANHPNAEVFRSALLLWCAAWHQVPAASLPDDDVELARYAGFGRDLDGWRAIRADAMGGFIACSDGRLYHPVVAEKALEAKSLRIKGRNQTAAATAASLAKRARDRAELNRLRQRRADVDVNVGADVPPPNVTETATTTLTKGREGKREGKVEEESNPIAHTFSVADAREGLKSRDEPSASTDPRWKNLAAALILAFEAANNPNAARVNPWSFLPQWFDLGYDPKSILAVVQAGLQKKPGVHGLGYFENQLREHHTKRDEVRAAAPAPATPTDWRPMLDTYERAGMWPATAGPRPNMAGCRVVLDLLVERGYRTLDGKLPPAGCQLDKHGRITGPPVAVARDPNEQRRVLA